MKRASILLCGAVVPALLPTTAQARPQWMSGTFVYADLCTRPDSGEASGRRITVRRSPNGDGVLYEAAPRGLEAPARAAEIVLDDATGALAFTAETDDGRVEFQGTARGDVLVGTLRDAVGARPVVLPRVLRSHLREACRLEPAASETTGSVQAEP